MMLSSFLARQAPATVAAIKTLVAPSLVAFPIDSTQHALGVVSNTQQQVRWVTKKRVHRQEKRKRKAELAAKGIFPPKPLGYIPRDAPVINAVSREERDAESRRQDEIAAKELKGRMEIVQAPLMRFDFNGEDLVMSDRVKMLFDLQNGNQSEVVKAQKQRGMEIFQRREADTGSSAVQGESDKWIYAVELIHSSRQNEYL